MLNYKKKKNGPENDECLFHKHGESKSVFIVKIPIFFYRLFVINTIIFILVWRNEKCYMHIKFVNFKMLNYGVPLTIYTQRIYIYFKLSNHFFSNRRFYTLWVTKKKKTFEYEIIIT